MFRKKKADFFCACRGRGGGEGWWLRTDLLSARWCGLVLELDRGVQLGDEGFQQLGLSRRISSGLPTMFETVRRLFLTLSPLLDAKWGVTLTPGTSRRLFVRVLPDVNTEFHERHVQLLPL